MNTALRCKDPVVVLEHVDLYDIKGEAPADDFDYCLPVGKAAVRRTGSRGHGALLPRHDQLRASRRSPRATIDAEVIDLRWLDRARSTGRPSAPACARPTA